MPRVTMPQVAELIAEPTWLTYNRPPCVEQEKYRRGLDPWSMTALSVKVFVANSARGRQMGAPEMYRAMGGEQR